MLSHISFGSLLLIVIIAIVVFGPKRLKNIGEDLGAAVKSFRKGLDGEGEKDINKNHE